MHGIHSDDLGNGIPAWAESKTFIYKNEDLAGVGTINGLSVQCIIPASQMIFQAGYELPEKQIQDMERLHERFQVPFSSEGS